MSGPVALTTSRWSSSSRRARAGRVGRREGQHQPAAAHVEVQGSQPGGQLLAALGAPRRGSRRRRPRRARRSPRPRSPGRRRTSSRGLRAGACRRRPGRRRRLRSAARRRGPSPPSSRPVRTPDSSHAHMSPVRPIPHWISSKISSAPCSSQASRAAASICALTGWMPPSPWIGSISTAAVRSETACTSGSGGPSRGHRAKARHERREGRLLGLLGGGRERPHRAAVEGALQHHEVAAGLVTAGELERALHRLGARSW